MPPDQMRQFSTRRTGAVKPKNFLT